MPFPRFPEFVDGAYAHAEFGNTRVPRVKVDGEMLTPLGLRIDYTKRGGKRTITQITVNTYSEKTRKKSADVSWKPSAAPKVFRAFAEQLLKHVNDTAQR